MASSTNSLQLWVLEISAVVYVLHQKIPSYGGFQHMWPLVPSPNPVTVDPGALFAHLQHLAANIHGFSKEHHIDINKNNWHRLPDLPWLTRKRGNRALRLHSRIQLPTRHWLFLQRINICSPFNSILSQISRLPTYQLDNSLTLRCSRLKRRVLSKAPPQGGIMRRMKRTAC